MTGADKIICQLILQKNNVVHFRQKSISRTHTVSSFCSGTIETTDKHTYLGVILSEHLDYNIMIKCVAQSVSLALGLNFNRKCKKMRFLLSYMSRLFGQL